MFASTTVLAALANIFISQSLGAAVPNAPEKVVARGGGYPASNPPGVSCYNTWETVTNDPVVQYWYVVVKDAGNQIKADRVWNHLNLNGCAPTENKYHVESDINGCALTFHTSEACTAARVSHALRSGSEPGINIACAFTGKEGPDPGEGAASAGDGVLEGILHGIGAFGGGE
ncbi:Uu.00g114300.m01.CDS01 [Anthostomella pinea]|uniref:Uu.00g114300.m01.CDS01 n=1 Tax=Anthostomella pinea TaxID=933095 RepID=A0AAI8YGM9_9PEZI|nr:Uu.00g114300.m01.CDS01 [Anthostomella pinea]